ncbi:MAG: LPS export ABC transporter ATP-binding protein [Gemmatimonadaceae bacterium]|jgi:lipopolysaccharide export system ATP-binding protein|nr:LPS export ABC transporter ATP-binding protein [Gemmatimonadaceae bacterium]
MSSAAELRRRLSAVSKGDRSLAHALAALVGVADEQGRATVNDIAVRYRELHLAALRQDGRDTASEAGRLSLDEVRQHLASSVLPRLSADELLELPAEGLGGALEASVRLPAALWESLRSERESTERSLRDTGEHAGIVAHRDPHPTVEAGSVLQAEGLVKVYRGRTVVNDVAVQLRQGEIVGLLGPNGAGKTTTFYMIVGLIAPMAGRIRLDGEDITAMPMYQRSRRGIGYLSQEPSIFRKLTVEENILAILETLPLSAGERESRLDLLLDELSIRHLRKSKAYQLSGGERRRLEITRALVTQPKFMMLDEPFAGVDPIAVHDIQQIVANLRHRGIGVLISDHNVEQTLDIVDRAYIMFDGQVKVSGTVRELVFDDTVADIYLGPTLTARLRERFAAAGATAD